MAACFEYIAIDIKAATAFITLNGRELRPRQKANGGSKMEALSSVERKYLYEVGDYVMYRRNGICRITDIRREKLGPEERLYYILKPVYDDTLKLYVPVDFVDAPQHMRRVLSAEEIDATIAQVEKSPNKWPEDSSERAVYFDGLLNGGDRADIRWLVKVLSLEKQALRKKEKRMLDSDKKALEAAERLITDEFAFVLGLGKNEVVPYILGQVRKREEACA